MSKANRSKVTIKKALTRLQKLSLWSYNNPRKTALLWLVVVLFGAACYTTLLKREGFPSIATPLSIGTGSYFVDDAAKVDSEVSKPLSQFVGKQEGVKSVQTQSFDNFYTAVINYEDGVDSKATGEQISQKVKQQQVLPANSTLNLAPFEFGFTTRGDNLVISYISNNPEASTEELTKKATEAAKFLKDQNLDLVRDVSIINPFETATNPLTGQTETSQRTFDIFGERKNESNKFHKSVIIGVKAEKGSDNIKLDDDVRAAVTKLNTQPQFEGYTAVISGSFAPQIKQQINELQKALLEGLIAILIICSLVIAIRASVITVVSMITVLAIVNGILYLVGYSLNTITLFGLILSLSLIVDDTIIMIEAIDNQRRRRKDPEEAVSEATNRVSKAMISATTTSALCFAPLIFVGGILGSFIRAIPITIMTALFISLVVALVFIPFFSRYLLLRKKDMGAENVKEPSAKIEAAIASFVTRPMMWAKGSTNRLFSVGLIALVIGFGFIFAGGYIFQKVTFNIFPNGKDGNQLTTTITYKPGTSIEEAQSIAGDVGKIVSQTTGSNFVQSTYNGEADLKSALQSIDIVDYTKRDETTPQYVKQLNAKFQDYQAASVKAGQADAGPPAADFSVQIESDANRQGATKLAEDIAGYVKTTELNRPDGTKVKIDSVSVANTSIYTREAGKQFVAVTIKYSDSDTTTLVNLTREAVKDKFPQDKVAGYGLSKDAISFNAGQEDENQDSFKTLGIAFPVLLLVIYIVLAYQFRSLLQPALIFMAIPFSFFGVTLGLWLTDNAFSFFAMLGFFALIGLSLKNTILLTDYANQARKAGMGPVDAAHEALAERFRPLIATSLTAVFSLIPLAILSPFWQGLSVVLIFGLVSSTFLVITVFPYYYLGSEYLRQRVNRRTGVSWLVLTIAFAMLLYRAGPALILAPVLAFAVIKLAKRLVGKSKSA